MMSYVVNPPIARLMTRTVESVRATNALKRPTHELSGDVAPVPAAVDDPRMTMTRLESPEAAPADPVGSVVAGEGCPAAPRSAASKDMTRRQCSV